MGVENNIPEGWIMTFLSDITNYIRRGITPKYCENESVFVINQRCIRDNKVSLLNARFHDLSLKDIGDEKRLKSGDILICSTGVGTLGRVAQYKLNDTLATVDSHVTIVRPNDNIFKPFLGLLLSGKEREIEFLAEGTTGQTELPRTSLGLLPINLPPLPEQKSIAKILTAFDDKIELLQAQNKTLETMAQTIFKEWFGKYQVGDELPEGWRVGKLGDYGRIVTGKTPSKKNPKHWGNQYPFVTPTDYKNFGLYSSKTKRYLSELGWNKMRTNQIQKKSIMVTCIGSDMGKVSINFLDSLTNQQINSIILSNEINLGFVYEFLKSQYQKLRIIALGGSTMPIINKSAFSNIEIPVPTNKLLTEFQRLWDPISLKVLTNSTHIQSLTKTRDTLLPKLMSGQVRVNNIKQTADA